MARTKQTAREASLPPPRKPFHTLTGASSSSSTMSRVRPHSPPALDNVPIQVNFTDGEASNFDDAMVLYDSCVRFENAIDAVVLANNNTVPSPLVIDMSNVTVEDRMMCTPAQLEKYYDYVVDAESVDIGGYANFHDLLAVAWCVDDIVLLDYLDEHLYCHPFIPRSYKALYEEKDEELWLHVRTVIKSAYPHVLLDIDNTSIAIKNPCITDMGHSKLLMDKLVTGNKPASITITGATVDAIRTWCYYRKAKKYATLPVDWLLITQGAIVMRDEHFLKELLPSLLCGTPQPVEFSAEEKEVITQLPDEVSQLIIRHTVLRAPKKKQPTKSCMVGEFDEVVDDIANEYDCIVVMGKTAFKCNKQVVASNNVFIVHASADTPTYYINSPHGSVTKRHMTLYLMYLHQVALGRPTGMLLAYWQEIFAAAWAVSDESFLKVAFPTFVKEHLYRTHNNTTEKVMGVPNVEAALAKYMPLGELVDEAYTYSSDRCMMLNPLKRKAEELVVVVDMMRKARKCGDLDVVTTCINKLEDSIAGKEVPATTG